MWEQELLLGDSAAICGDGLGARPGAGSPGARPSASTVCGRGLVTDYSAPATFLFGRFIFAKCFIIFYEPGSTETQGICLLCLLLKQTKECRPIGDLLLPVTPMEFQEATTGALTPPSAAP